MVRFADSVLPGMTLLALVKNYVVAAWTLVP
jgi:hypothetical protein